MFVSVTVTIKLILTSGVFCLDVRLNRSEKVNSVIFLRVIHFSDPADIGLGSKLTVNYLFIV